MLHLNSVWSFSSGTRKLPELCSFQRARHNLPVLAATSVSEPGMCLFASPLPVSDQNLFVSAGSEYITNNGIIVNWCTLIPFWHRAKARTRAIFEGFPTRRTFLVPWGILLRTTAAAKLVPSTILILSFGLFLQCSPPLSFNSSACTRNNNKIFSRITSTGRYKATKWFVLTWFKRPRLTTLAPLSSASTIAFSMKSLISSLCDDDIYCTFNHISKYKQI